jgi:tetratricopeptide (TPR) repeat protein
MKKYIPLFIFVLCSVAAFSQAGKKTAAKEKPPTQKEMEAMMKEAEKMMGEISAEDKKMMDSMGFKMPDTKQMKKSVSGISDAQLKKAFEDENRIVPVKDVARINSALSISLTAAQMPAYIEKTHLVVLKQLSAQTKTRGNEILQQLLQSNSPVDNAAAGLWIEGKPTLALYLMGEVCKANAADANNLNNYASFLTTCGGEEMALPILNLLNKQYPQNSTLLNNMAQAWLGLGDIPRAEKYADSAIQIYPAHPQANLAKSLIEESKGNIQATIAAAKKSISEAYSAEKQSRLKKLGYTIKSEDLSWEPPVQKNIMGLDKFTWPKYPFNVEETKSSEIEWSDFKDNCNQLIAELKVKQATAEKEFERITGLRMQQVIQAVQTGTWVQPMPGYAAKAMVKLDHLVNGVNGNMSFVFTNELEAVLRAMKRAAELENVLEEKQAMLDKKYEDKIGEGKENPLNAICAEENGIRNEFLKDANGGIQTAYRQYLHFTSKRISDMLYYYQFVQWPEQFELTKISAQISWLTQLRDQRPYFKPKSSWCVPVVPKKPVFDSLQNFDDVACQYVSTMNLGVYKIVSSCSNLTGEFDLKGVKISLKDNAETGKFSGTAILGLSKSVGPAGLKLKGTVGGLVEFDNSGITDVGLVAGVSVKGAGLVTIVGGEVKGTFNTGISTSGKFLGHK